MTLLPPVRPGKFIVVGLNYMDHAREIRAELPAAPRFNYVPGSAVAGAHDDVELPEVAPDEVDYEGELAVVIGPRATRVREEDAWSHVAGVTVANDMSARDVQRGSGLEVQAPNIGVAKAFDTFKPLGPALLTVDDITLQTDFRITTWVDGQVRQDSSTANWVFRIPRLIACISRHTTLEPGDVVLTGTPGGVGLGTGRFLAAGQVVEVEVEGIGRLVNKMVRTA